jgi:hypothetical protein
MHPGRQEDHRPVLLGQRRRVVLVRDCVHYVI